MATTEHFHWTLPNPGSDADNWGEILNAAFDAVDEALHQSGLPTGAVMDFLRTEPPTGWLELNGTTIGKDGSGAAHMGVALQALYVLLWNSFGDAVCPVGGGRGGSAGADWDGNKPLALVNQSGRFRRTSGGGAAAMGMLQEDQMQQITGNLGRMVNYIANVDGAFSITNNVAQYAGGSGQTGQVTFNSANSPGARVGSETRPVNIAYLTCIKL